MKTAVLCFMAFAIVAETSFAQPSSRSAKEQALERLATGDRFYVLRDFERAITEWKAGVLIENLPAFSYNLGQAYRQMGNYEEAIWHYERYLPRASNPQRKRDAERFIKEMRAELEKKARTTPPVETLPNAENQPPTGKPPTARAPKVVTVIDRGEAWYADPLGWGLAGVGGIGLGVSVGLIFSAKNLDDRANGETAIEVRDSLHERASDRRLVGVILGVVGAGALATGIVKLAIYPKDRERKVTTTFHVGVTRDGLVVMGRF